MRPAWQDMVTIIFSGPKKFRQIFILLETVLRQQVQGKVLWHQELELPSITRQTRYCASCSERIKIIYEKSFLKPFHTAEQRSKEQENDSANYPVRNATF